MEISNLPDEFNGHKDAHWPGEKVGELRTKPKK